MTILGWGPAAAGPQVASCRALVAGFGVRARRDLDFGRQAVRYLSSFPWPPGVVVEDLPYAAHLALHRVDELQPPKLVLVGAAARGGVPGSVRCRRLGHPAPATTGPAELAEGVAEALAESIAGAGDLDHTLAVLGHWGALPADTVLIEVEPADCSFGTGFSEEVGCSLDTVLTLVREELGDAGACDQELAEEVPPPEAAPPDEGPPEPSPALAALVDYAGRRRAAQAHEKGRGPGPMANGPEGIEVVGRSRPWAIGLDGGGDWWDVFPLDHGAVGIVVGDAPGCGVGAAALKSDLRVAVAAYVVIEGRFPARLVSCLDRFVAATGRGEGAALVYMVVQPDTGELRLCSAGMCPPLIVDEHGGRFLHEQLTAPVGAPGAGHRREVSGQLGPGATLLAYTDGLVTGPNRSRARGLASLLDAALTGPLGLEALCGHVVGACANHERRDDDLTVVGARATTTP